MTQQPEQRLRRTTIINGIRRMLKQLWRQAEALPVPQRFTRLLSELGTSGSDKPLEPQSRDRSG